MDRKMENKMLWIIVFLASTKTDISQRDEQDLSLNIPALLHE